MKHLQQPTFLAIFLALATTNAVAVSSSSLQAAGSNSGRRVEEGVDPWTENLWDNVLDTIGFGDEDSENPDVCDFIELALGMGTEFVMDANCSCDEDPLSSGLQIHCNYQECAPGTEICGAVDLKFGFGGANGAINMTSCSDFTGDAFEETCFSYSTGDAMSFSDQKCEASYGGQPCGCEIENGIFLSIDCADLLPGAVADSQGLSMMSGGDLGNWLPNFDIFQPDFQLEAGDIPWETMDFENLDFANFNVSSVNWGEEFLGQTWLDLVGDNPTFLNAEELSPGVCTILYQAASLTETMGAESSCDCGYDETQKALNLSCNFAETCTDGEGPLCGNVRLDLTYASLDEIFAEVCIQYAQFPETCYSYGIPFADVLSGAATGDLTTPFFRDCSAKYGGADNNCKCTMDENSCLTVDCSDFEPLAITDECQVIDFGEDPSGVVLNFRSPGANDVVSDGNGEAFEELNLETVASKSAGVRRGAVDEIVASMVASSVVAAALAAVLA
jgi:hypothetical protein